MEWKDTLQRKNEPFGKKIKEMMANKTIVP